MKKSLYLMSDEELKKNLETLKTFDSKGAEQLSKEIEAVIAERKIEADRVKNDELDRKINENCIKDKALLKDQQKILGRFYKLNTDFGDVFVKVIGVKGNDAYTFEVINNEKFHSSRTSVRELKELVNLETISPKDFYMVKLSCDEYFEKNRITERGECFNIPFPFFGF